MLRLLTRKYYRGLRLVSVQNGNRYLAGTNRARTGTAKARARAIMCRHMCVLSVIHSHWRDTGGQISPSPWCRTAHRCRRVRYFFPTPPSSSFRSSSPTLPTRTYQSQRCSFASTPRRDHQPLQIFTDPRRPQCPALSTASPLLITCYQVFHARILLLFLFLLLFCRSFFQTLCSWSRIIFFYLFYHVRLRQFRRRRASYSRYQLTSTHNHAVNKSCIRPPPPPIICYCALCRSFRCSLCVFSLFFSFDLLGSLAVCTFLVVLFFLH